MFVAFTQHCTQNNVTHIGGVKGVLYSIYSSLSTPARREGYLNLLSWGFSSSTTSQSEEAALLTFLDLSTTRVIAGKTHSQSPILKTKGALSNLVILRYLQTKLYPPHSNQTACLVYEFRSEKHFQCLKNVGLYNSFCSWQVQFLAKLAHMSK